MKDKKSKSKVNTIFGILVGLVGIVCGLWLLIFFENKITGSEFVALVLGFSVIGLIIAFAAEIQEFSIAGNGVKLKDLTNEAEKKIEELQEAKTELFRLMIPQILQDSQTTLSRVDPRIKTFLNVYEQVQKFGVVDKLRNEIEKVLHVLLIVQYGKLKLIHQSHKTVYNNFDELNSPKMLSIKLKDDMIEKIILNKQPQPNFYDEKKDVIEAIEAYSKLYAIKVRLDKLDNINAQTHLLCSRISP